MKISCKRSNEFHYTFLDTLAEYVEKVLKTKNRALISVVGKNGTGKSCFGRYIRKHGIGRFNKRAVTVIDDRVMVQDFLYFFKKRLKIPRNGFESIEPLLSNLPERIKIVFYINNTPAEKIKQADILLKLTTDEQTRRQRLQKRYSNEPEKLKKYLDRAEIEDYGIQFSYLLESEI